MCIRDRVTIMIARDIVNKEPGDKMVPIAEYERNCGFSRWTIQTTIKTLLDHGCMTIEKCGPKGTFLEKINYEKLWTFTDWDPLLGCVPVQTSKTLSGLLTGCLLYTSNPAFWGKTCGNRICAAFYRPDQRERY